MLYLTSDHFPVCEYRQDIEHRTRSHLMLHSCTIWSDRVRRTVYHTYSSLNSPCRLYRYLWYLIRVAASFAYRPIPLPQNPTYLASEDVTIIVPTIDAGEEFKEAAHSWLVGNPKEILIITEEKMKSPLQDLAHQVNPHRIRVLTVPFANKRLQMVHGIRNTSTDIIVFADDDAIWPSTMLPYILACFEGQKVGGVGTSQRVHPVGGVMTVWEVLAAFRLSIRNIEIACSTHIDSGIPCLSGRTAAYRTIILKDPEFLHSFTHDYWLGRYQLNSGDDKFLTRWMVSHGWSTYVQCCKEAELLSTMKPDRRFLKQVLRWTRNTWRSDLRSLFLERDIWTAHPYVAYTMVGPRAWRFVLLSPLPLIFFIYGGTVDVMTILSCQVDKLFNPITLLVGPVLVSYLTYKSTLSLDQGGFHLPWWYVYLTS